MDEAALAYSVGADEAAYHAPDEDGWFELSLRWGALWLGARARLPDEPGNVAERLRERHGAFLNA